MSSELRHLFVLLLGTTIALLAAFQLPGDVFFDFGPNDARYLQGFREDFEIDEPTFIHWSSRRSSVELPFALHGPYRVTLRFKRHVAASAQVRLFLGGELAESFVVPQGEFERRSFEHDNEQGGVFRAQILSQSLDPRPLGLALDWMQIEPAPGWGSILPTPRAFLALLGFVALFVAYPRLLGFRAPVSFAIGAGAAVTLALLAAWNKLWPVHAVLTLGARPYAAAVLLAVFFQWRRRRPGSAFAHPLARWALLIVFAGMAIRLIGLFHPDFYYPDVRTHSKFVSLIWTEGLESFLSNHIANQHRHLLGLQLVGDSWRAFPYPPLLYLTIYPLSLLQLPVDDWMKFIPTLLLAFEALVLFAMAFRLGASPHGALAAVALHATARVVAFRLAVASYAALFGHFWDMLVGLYLVLFFDRMERLPYALGFAILVSVSLLSYAGSALVLGMFVPLFAVATWKYRDRLLPKRALAVAGWALAAAAFAFIAFYAQYLPELFEDSGTSTMGDMVELRFTPLDALEMAAYRFRLFYGWLQLQARFAHLGWVFPAAIVGAVLMVRSRKLVESPLAFPLTVASVGTFVGLNFLRAGLGATHIFQFTKDDLVVLPLACIALGVSLAAIAKSSSGKVAAVSVMAVWIVWGLVAFSGDIRSRFIRPDYEVSSRKVKPVLVLVEEFYPARAGLRSQDAKTTRLPPSRLAR